MSTDTAGLKFINRRKVEIDIVRHADIMEDAIDRIRIKEIIKKGKFVPIEEAFKRLDKIHGISNSNRAKGRKVSKNGTK